MKRTIAAGEIGAIYCRVSLARDDDQTGVDRQERICRETAERLGVVVPPDLVFVDNSLSAWQRKRKRPGWDAMLAAIKSGRVRHLLAYHPDRLMRQPWDLEELLRLADDHELLLHGQANRRDLSNPDDRFFLRIEVAHACRSSDDTSRRIKDQQAEAAAAGRPHGGRRAYGYTQSGSELIETEAEIVREMFRRFLDGASINSIAVDLNRRNVPSAGGGGWSPDRIRQMLCSPRHAGLRTYRGEVMKDESGAYLLGTWEPCVTVGEWEEATRLRRQRSMDYTARRSNFRPYLLRGLVLCGNCGRVMVGSVMTSQKSGSKKYPTYVCNYRTAERSTPCKRRIGADNLERFVQDAAIDLLSRLNVSQLSDASLAGAAARDRSGIEDDEQRLTEVRQMWVAKEITTDEYREMRAAVAARIAKATRGTSVRPITALEGITTGAEAAAAWNTLPDERKAAVLRFLFAGIRIGPATSRNRFDYGRIDIEQTDLMFLDATQTA